MIKAVRPVRLLVTRFTTAFQAIASRWGHVPCVIFHWPMPRIGCEWNKCRVWYHDVGIDKENTLHPYELEMS